MYKQNISILLLHNTLRHKDSKKPKKESLRGLKSRKKFAYVKLDID